MDKYLTCHECGVIKYMEITETGRFRFWCDEKIICRECYYKIKKVNEEILGCMQRSTVNVFNK